VIEQGAQPTSKHVLFVQKYINTRKQTQCYVQCQTCLSLSQSVMRPFILFPMLEVT